MKYSFAIAIALVCCGVYCAQAANQNGRCPEGVSEMLQICESDAVRARQCNYNCDDFDDHVHMHFGRSIPDGTIPTDTPLGGSSRSARSPNQDKVPKRPHGMPPRWG